MPTTERNQFMLTPCLRNQRPLERRSCAHAHQTVSCENVNPLVHRSPAHVDTTTTASIATPRLSHSLARALFSLTHTRIRIKRAARAGAAVQIIDWPSARVQACKLGWPARACYWVATSVSFTPCSSENRQKTNL